MASSSDGRARTGLRKTLITKARNDLPDDFAKKAMEAGGRWLFDGGSQVGTASLLLVAMPFAPGPSSVLAPSSKARSP